MEQQKGLKHGAYKIFWKSGGVSVASIGFTYDGTNWFAPCNWTSEDNSRPLVASTDWNKVERIELIMANDYSVRRPSSDKPKKYRVINQILSPMGNVKEGTESILHDGYYCFPYIGRKFNDNNMGWIGNSFIAADPSLEPKLFEEVKERDWEIVAFRTTIDKPHYAPIDLYERNESGFYIEKNSGFGWTEYQMINGSNAKIHSVRRLSDGEVFSVGDEVTDGTRNIKIKSFRVSSSGEFMDAEGEHFWYNITEIKKLPSQQSKSKDYEILSIIQKQENSSIEDQVVLSVNDLPAGKNVEQYLAGIWDIFSVRRNGDGEIFVIGDIISTNLGKGRHKIEGFEIIGGDMCAMMPTFPARYEFIKSIQLPPQSQPATDKKEFNWTNDSVREFAEFYRSKQGKPLPHEWGRDFIELFWESKSFQQWVSDRYDIPPQSNKERIEVSVSRFKEYYDPRIKSMRLIVNPSQGIPEWQLPQIKQAIERVLNAAPGDKQWFNTTELEEAERRAFAMARKIPLKPGGIISGFDTHIFQYPTFEDYKK
jgi:hypothetical protein